MKQDYIEENQGWINKELPFKWKVEVYSDEEEQGDKKYGYCSFAVYNDEGAHYFDATTARELEAQLTAFINMIDKVENSTDVRFE